MLSHEGLCQALLKSPLARCNSNRDTYMLPCLAAQSRADSNGGYLEQHSTSKGMDRGWTAMGAGAVLPPRPVHSSSSHQASYSLPWAFSIALPQHHAPVSEVEIHALTVAVCFKHPSNAPGCHQSSREVGPAASTAASKRGVCES